MLVTMRDPENVPLYVDARRELVLDENDPENLRDAREYVETFLARHDTAMSLDMPTVEFTQLVIERSEGNFMYLRHVLHGIRDNTIRGGLDELPRGPLWPPWIRRATAAPAQSTSAGATNSVSWRPVPDPSGPTTTEAGSPDSIRSPVPSRQRSPLSEAEAPADLLANGSCTRSARLGPSTYSATRYGCGGPGRRPGPRRCRTAAPAGLG
jgi:hypothetical protein